MALKKIDRIFGFSIAAVSLLFLLFGVSTISEDWRKATGAQYFTVGPRLFPYIAGSLCLMLGLLIGLKPGQENEISAIRDKKVLHNLGLALGIIIFYGATLNIFGFLIGTLIALLLFLLAFGERRWYLILPISFGVPLIIFYVFLKVFMLELPLGFLEMPL